MISVRVVVDVRRSVPARTKRNLQAMWSGFIGIILSGIVLVIVTPSSLGHACALMSLYIVIVSGVHLYQKRATSLV